MDTFYAYCAAIGAALLIGQFLLSLIGFGEHGGLDGGHDFDCHSGDVPAGMDGLHSDVHADHFDRGGQRYAGLLSVRAIVAALAVFGLVGLGLSRQFDPPRPAATFVIAFAAGAAMMYGLASLLRGLYTLRSDGTVRIERAIGLSGTAYLSIPAKKAGVGKITVKVQDRTMEYTAMTSGDEIPTGTAVVVLGVLSPQIVEVAPAAPQSQQTPAGHTHV